MAAHCRRASEIQSFSPERREKILALHAAYEAVWVQVLQQGHEAGVFRPYSKLRLKGLLGLYYYSYIWIRPNRPELVAEAAETFHDTVLCAVLKTDADPS